MNVRYHNYKEGSIKVIIESDKDKENEEPKLYVPLKFWFNTDSRMSLPCFFIPKKLNYQLFDNLLNKTTIKKHELDTSCS